MLLKDCNSQSNLERRSSVRILMQVWKTVRVFISSTFRDMHAERDFLVRFVFPELRERCAKRQLHLIDVDLRWGVTEDEMKQVLNLTVRGR